MHVPTSLLTRVRSSVAITTCALLLAACGTTTKQEQPGTQAATGTTHLRILGFNDFHGALRAQETGRISVNDPTDPKRMMAIPAGGVAYLAAHVKQLRAQAPHSLVISSGDLFGASPLTSALFRDEGTIEAMNTLGLDYNAVGNHEFDRGPDEIKRLIKGGCADTSKDSTFGSCPLGTFQGAKFKFLSVNALNRADGSLLFTPYEVRTFDNIKVGIVGALLTQAHTVIAPQPVKDVRFDEDVASINRAVQAMKAQGVQHVILTIHQGGMTDSTYNDTTCTNARGEIFRMAPLLDPAVSVILSAHTHQAYNCRVPNPNNTFGANQRIVISSATNGRLLAHLDLKFDRATQRLISVEANNRVVTNDQSSDPEVLSKFPPMQPDPQVLQLVERYTLAAAPKVNQPIGRISAAISRADLGAGQSALGRLIAQGQLAATNTPATGGAQIAMTNPGSIRADLPMMPGGVVTYGMLFAVQPFGNALMTMTLTGQQLKEVLEQQWTPTGNMRPLQVTPNFEYSYDANQPAGQRIMAKSLKIDGKLISPTDRVRVTANQFLAAGGDLFTVLKDGTDAMTGVQDIDAFVAHMRSQPVHAPTQGSQVKSVTANK